MRRLLLLILLALALCAVDPSLIAPPAAEAAKPVVTRPRAKSTQSAKSNRSTKSTRSRRSSSVRSTRRPTTRRDSTKSISSHVSQRVRRASMSSNRSAGSAASRSSIRSSVSRRFSTQRSEQRASQQRRQSVSKLSTRSTPGKRMGVLPRLKMTLRRWITARRGDERQSVARAHNRHSVDSRNRASSSASKGGANRQSSGSAASIKWPPNYGFKGTPVQKTLPAGTRVDRYGYEGGRFVSPAGTPYAARALPPGSDKKPFNTYVTTRPVSVKAGAAAPWFNQPGGGTQYHLPDKVRNLVDSGAMRRASQ